MYVIHDDNEADDNADDNDTAAAAASIGDDNNEANDPATVAAAIAKSEVESLRTELFAKLDAISQRLSEQPAHVPATDSRKPNNAATIEPDYAALSPHARIAAGYKS